ncbi:MAG TPA: hypothetical protein VIG64_03530 [Actinomycetota bacterium]|jgi:hypothetical protein
MRLKNKLRVLVALAIVPAAIGLTPSSVNAEQFTFPYFANPNNPCTQDIMFYEGNAHVVFNVTTNPDGSFHIQEHLNTQGVTAEGFPSGDHYVVNEGTNSTQEFDVSAQPTQSHTVHHLIINHTPNTPLDDYHEHFNMTTTWVGGVPQPFFSNQRAECK